MSAARGQPIRAHHALVSIAALCGACAHLPPPEAASDTRLASVMHGPCAIRVQLVGLDPTRGAGPVQVALWASEKDFMKDGNWLRGASVPIAQADHGVVFDGLPPGAYAISAFHDTAASGTLRRGLFGIPLDPWAISNGSAGFVPPSWGRASFELSAPSTTIELDFGHRPRNAP